VTWQVIEEMAIRGWKMLEPIYQREHGRKGRLSIQINPTFNRSPEKMLEQARHFDSLAPNVQVKFPATSAGLEALEQATYEGISINATVSFTVSQALAVGAAVDRALARREAGGLGHPGCRLSARS
jgi:transaldolase